MNDQQTFFSRIGTWFKKGGHYNGDLPLMHEDESNGIEPRGTFLRPWARRDQAIDNLQQGFHTLTDLMSSIKEHLEQNGQRQDQLLNHLAHLPQAIQSIPESNRMQGETLKAIHHQLEHQNDRQKQLADILDKICDADGNQKETLDALNERVETLNQHDQAIAENLQNVGLAMRTVSHNSQTSAQVLEQMRDNIDSRDGQIERILHKQNTRFTTMLAIAIFLSVAALAAVGVVGYLLLNRA